jgi:hypothetical protein
MPDPTQFEVRCERCKTSFALGTKQCVHCGGAIGRRLLAFDTLAGVRPGAAPPRDDLSVGAADSQPSVGRLIRFALIGLGILAALARGFFQDR